MCGAVRGGGGGLLTMESQLGVGQQQQQRAGQVRLLPWVVARVVEYTTPPLCSACVGRHCAVERELGEGTMPGSWPA